MARMTASRPRYYTEVSPMKMDTHINLRLPSGIYAVMEQRARQHGISVSEAIRQAMSKSIGDVETPRAKEIH